MSVNSEITKLSNEIANFEQNINKITIIILVVENHQLITLFKNNLATLNNIILREELIEHLKSIELLKDYKIQYILKFMITKSLEELNSTINLEDSYTIIPLTSLDNLTFSELPTNNIRPVTKHETKYETKYETKHETNYETKLNNTFTRINSLIIVVKKKQ
jgi:hypothetical protein